MNIALDILNRLRRPVDKRVRHRFLAAEFLPPPPPTPNPATMTPQQEAVLARVRQMPMIVAIDPASSVTLGPWNPYLRDSANAVYFSLSGWGYLGLHTLSDFPMHLIPGGVETYLLHSPLQLVAIRLDDPMRPQSFREDLRSGFECRTIAVISRGEVRICQDPGKTLIK